MPVTPLCRLPVSCVCARTRTKMPTRDRLGGEMRGLAAYVLLCPPKAPCYGAPVSFGTCRVRAAANRHHSTKVEGLIPHDAVLPKSFPADAQGAQPCCVAAITRQRSGVSGATIGDRFCPQ